MKLVSPGSFGVFTNFLVFFIATRFFDIIFTALNNFPVVVFSKRSNILYFFEGIPLIYDTKFSGDKISSFSLEVITCLNIGSSGDIDELIFFLL